MALNKKLLSVLNEDLEPLPKRLKIANNAFKYVDLPMQKREVFLLKWLVDLDSNDENVWQTFYDWILSPHINNISKNDINVTDVLFLTNIIIDKLHIPKLNANVKQLVLKSGAILIRNKTFQLYYKYNLEQYFKLLLNLLKYSDNEHKEFISNLLQNDFLLNVGYGSKESYNHLLDFIINDFMEMLLECPTFRQIGIGFIQKSVFNKSLRYFDSLYKQLFESTEDPVGYMPKTLIKKLRNSYNLDLDKCKFTYRIIFNAYCLACKNDHVAIFKFTLILMEIIGFDLGELIKLNNLDVKLKIVDTDLNKSLPILSELFEVLATLNMNAQSKIEDVTASDLFSNLLSLILNMQNDSDNFVYTCKIVKSIITMDPLIVESLISEVLMFIVFNTTNATCEKHREDLLISTMEVFAKLHRIQNLISKMIPMLKLKLSGKCTSLTENTKSKIKMDGLVARDLISIDIEANNIFTKRVLSYFTNCVTSLASWQVINLFKTFLFHLNDYFDANLHDGSNQVNLLYMELLGIIVCQFLSSVRMAEHIVSNLVLNKFMAGMDELQAILGKFGSSLLLMEHNHILMGAFLNIAYNWAELYMVMCYYSINGEIKPKTKADKDFSFCNVTYLHSYLTREQWSLLSQRITNFGEKPCKQIMHKLAVQKIKTMMMFENTVSEEALAAVVNELSVNLEENHELLLTDSFAMKNIVGKFSLDQKINVSRLFMDEMIKSVDSNDVLIVRNLNENVHILNGMLYNALLGINKSTKQKNRGLKISKLLQVVSAECFIDNEDDSSCLDNLQKVVEVFNDEETESDTNFKCKAGKLRQYILLIKTLPLVYMTKFVRTVTFIALLSLLPDLRISLADELIINDIESVLIGLVQNGYLLFVEEMKPSATIKFILRNIVRYEELFTYMVEMLFQNAESIVYFKGGVNYLCKNIEDEKHLKCSLIVLNQIYKFKRQHVSADSKAILNDFKAKICDNLESLILTSDDNERSIEAYSNVLKHCLANSSGNLPELKSHLNNYANKAMQQLITTSEVKGPLELFFVLLSNKTQFENVNVDFVKKLWDACKSVNPESKDDEELFCKLIMLIFEYVPDEHFEEICRGLLTRTLKPLEKRSYQLFTKRVNVWNHILMCSFNPYKCKVWQNVLQLFLQNIVLVHDTLTSDYFKAPNIQCVLNLQLNVIKKTQLPLTPSIIDVALMSVSIFTQNANNFEETFGPCIAILEALLKYRNGLIVDRLPSFLQQYRTLLEQLCSNSTSELELSAVQVQNVSDCAHQFEKLTKNLVDCGKHIARISLYLIADILKYYETVTVHPNVKLHLNNCVYNLLKLCDQHAVTYLMRILSPASTEIFKLIYENYKKYFRFTGKV